MGHDDLFNTLQSAQNDDPAELLQALRNLRIHPQGNNNDQVMIDLNAEDDDKRESMNWDDDDQEGNTKEGLSLTDQAIESPTTAAATAALFTAIGHFSTNDTKDAL